MESSCSLPSPNRFSPYFIVFNEHCHNLIFVCLRISVGAVCNVISVIGGTVGSGSVHLERDTVAWQQIWCHSTVSIGNGEAN